MKVKTILNESSALAPWMFKTKKAITEFLEHRMLSGHFVINPDLTVDITSEPGGGILSLSVNNWFVGTNNHRMFASPDEQNGALPVQFNKVKCGMIFGSQASTFIGCPREFVEGFGFYANAKKITSLEGIPSVAGIINLVECRGITNLQNVHKFINSIDKIIIPTAIKSNVLGILLIKRINEVGEWNNYNESLKTVIGILNKHLQGDKDVLDCQEELIKAGLKEYAKL